MTYTEMYKLLFDAQSLLAEAQTERDPVRVGMAQTKIEAVVDALQGNPRLFMPSVVDRLQEVQVYLGRYFSTEDIEQDGKIVHPDDTRERVLEELYGPLRLAREGLERNRPQPAEPETEAA